MAGGPETRAHFSASSSEEKIAPFRLERYTGRRRVPHPRFGRVGLGVLFTRTVFLPSNSACPLRSGRSHLLRNTTNCSTASPSGATPASE